MHAEDTDSGYRSRSLICVSQELIPHAALHLRRASGTPEDQSSEERLAVGGCEKRKPQPGRDDGRELEQENTEPQEDEGERPRDEALNEKAGHTSGTPSEDDKRVPAEGRQLGGLRWQKRETPGRGQLITASTINGA